MKNDKQLTKNYNDLKHNP